MSISDILITRKIKKLSFTNVFLLVRAYLVLVLIYLFYVRYTYYNEPESPEIAREVRLCCY